jgi:hypothetical protein
MNGLFTETGIDTEVLQEYLGDNYFNDPETRQQPTKMFDNIKDEKGLVNFAATAQRELSSSGKRHEEALKKATEGMVRIPKNGDSEEIHKNFRTAINAGEKPEDYILTIPEGDDKEGYALIADKVRTAACAEGISKTKVAKIWDTVVAGLSEMMKDIDNKGLEILQLEEKALKDELKDKYPGFMKTTDEVLLAIENNKNSTGFTKLLETFGLKNNPIIRKLLGDLAPLIIESPTFGGKGAVKSESTEWHGGYKEVEENHEE